jgi:glycolate oxidase
LLIELDGTEAQVTDDARRLQHICEVMRATDVRVIKDEREAQTYWKARVNLGPMILRLFPKMVTEDVTVPRNRIPEFVRALQNISASIGMIIGIGGHAGDGNMHPTIVFPELNDDLEQRAKEGIKQIIKTGLALGGTVSGEHGIGLHKAEFTLWELGETQIALQKRIKQAFDPLGIMNPGKIWPQEVA